jgi:hypothetical protein
MFTIETLHVPIERQMPYGLVTLTHKMTMLAINPRFKDKALVLTEAFGYMDGGEFVDFGEFAVHELDKEGLTDLISNTRGGKPAGSFRTTDILPAIERRKQEKAPKNN